MPDDKLMTRVFWIGLILAGAAAVLVVNMQTASASTINIYDQDNPGTQTKWQTVKTGGDGSWQPSVPDDSNPVAFLRSDFSNTDTLTGTDANPTGTGAGTNGNCNFDDGNEANGYDIYVNSTLALNVDNLTFRMRPDRSGDANGNGQYCWRIGIAFLNLANNTYTQVTVLSEFCLSSCVAATWNTKIAQYGGATNLSMTTNSTRLHLTYSTPCANLPSFCGSTFNFQVLQANGTGPQNIHTQYVGKLEAISRYERLNFTLNSTIKSNELQSIRLGTGVSFTPGQHYVYLPRLLFFNVSGFSESMPGTLDDTALLGTSCNTLAIPSANTGNRNNVVFNGTSVESYDEYLVTVTGSTAICSLFWQFDNFDPLPTNLSQVWVPSFNGSLPQVGLPYSYNEYYKIADSTYINTQFSLPLVRANRTLGVTITCVGGGAPCDNVQNHGGTNDQYWFYGSLVAPFLFDGENPDLSVIFNGTYVSLLNGRQMVNFTKTSGTAADWNFTIVLNPSINNSFVGRDVYLPVLINPCILGTASGVPVFNLTVNGYMASFFEQPLENFTSDFTKMGSPGCGSPNWILRHYYIDRQSDYNNNSTSYQVQVSHRVLTSTVPIFALISFNYNGQSQQMYDKAWANFTLSDQSPNAATSPTLLGDWGFLLTANATPSIPLPISSGLFNYYFNVTDNTNGDPLAGAVITLLSTDGNSPGVSCTTSGSGACTIVSNRESKVINVAKTSPSYTPFSFSFTPNQLNTSANLTIGLNPVPTGSSVQEGAQQGLNQPGTQQIIFKSINWSTPCFCFNFSINAGNPVVINITRLINVEDLIVQWARVDPSLGRPVLLTQNSFVWRTTHPNTIPFRYPPFGQATSDLIGGYVLSVRNGTIFLNQTKVMITSASTQAAFEAVNFTLGPQQLTDLKQQSDTDVDTIVAIESQNRLDFAQTDLKAAGLGFLSFVFGTALFIPNIFWFLIAAMAAAVFVPTRERA